jgi:hypothetical protein
VGLGEVRLQGQGVAEGRRRILQPAKGEPRLAEVVLDGWVVGLQAYGLADQFGSLSHISLLAMEDAEQMERHDVARGGCRADGAP